MVNILETNISELIFAFFGFSIVHIDNIKLCIYYLIQ